MVGHRADLGRTVRLFGAFRSEGADPERFYRMLGRDVVGQLGVYTELRGALVADVGSGPGYLGDELRAAGARCVGVEHDFGELLAGGGAPAGSVVGTALRLPLRDGSVDVCLSSNVLEHVTEPWRMGGEMLRVTKPGGIVYLSFTNWLSPWGGHETSPWHYLGGDRAARRYRRRHGHPPKNLHGVSLHPVSVSAALAWAGTWCYRVTATRHGKARRPDRP